MGSNSYLPNLLVASLALFALFALAGPLAAPARADIAPRRAPCAAPGDPCERPGGEAGLCVEFTCTPEFYSHGSTRLSPTTCVECRDPASEAPERTRETVEPAEPIEATTEPAAEATATATDVTPAPEDPTPASEDDSFFGCAANGPGRGLTPLGPLAFVALAWSVFLIRRRRGR